MSLPGSSFFVLITPNFLFFSQAQPLPYVLLNAAPDCYIRTNIEHWGAPTVEQFLCDYDAFNQRRTNIKMSVSILYVS